MNLTPLLEASWVVQVHAFAAMAGFVLGLVQLIAPKGTLPHRALGVVWIGIMSIVAGTSIFIYREIEPGEPFWARYSFIHIFTIVTIFGIVSGILILLRGGPSLKRHAWPFISVFIGGLVIAGGFAFAPGRLMHEVVFGG